MCTADLARGHSVAALADQLCWSSLDDAGISTTSFRMYLNSRRADLTRKQRNKLKKLGLCIRGCGKKPRIGKLICGPCAATEEVSRKLRFNKRKKRGLCVDCGEKAMIGKTLCKDCGA